MAVVLMPKAVFAKKTFRPNIIILHKHKVLKKTSRAIQAQYEIGVNFAQYEASRF